MPKLSPTANPTKRITNKQTNPPSLTHPPLLANHSLPLFSFMVPPPFGKMLVAEPLSDGIYVASGKLGCLPNPPPSLPSCGGEDPADEFGEGEYDVVRYLDGPLRSDGTGGGGCGERWPCWSGDGVRDLARRKGSRGGGCSGSMRLLRRRDLGGMAGGIFPSRTSSSSAMVWSLRRQFTEALFPSAMAKGIRERRAPASPLNGAGREASRPGGYLG